MLEKAFNPQTAEKEIFQKWTDKDLFACHPESEKPPFSIVIPPPNVTGNLHIGHALNYALQDTVCRYKRMKGFDVLWQPGTDHAGIATQMVVERMLAKENISRHDLGREKFLEKVWEWKAHSGGQIVNQLKRLGCSCDWSRERFTMDEGLSAAVRKVFVKMYKDGLIYRDKRLVNWDPKLQTAISDLEVVQKETVGKMWYFKYPLENNPEKFIMVGTTRPETLFGDTAVAVSDKDERYQDFIGKNVLIPIINKPIPVVADEHADPEKGTGAVKITPAHDFNDFEVGKRHQLPLVNLLTKEAKLNENVPEKYQGMSPLQARPLVLEDIKALGLYDHEEDNPMTIPYGDRSDVIIEPWLTDQWFVDTSKLAPAAVEAVKSGNTKFVPENWENMYYSWMQDIQPWCISRQLWWGHQVPVWYGPDGKIFCEETEQLAQAEADKHYGQPTVLTRDTDVLDTWFSSGLWAFSTLGWPNEDDVHLKKYYPTSVLITGFDIIFFWVARMMMMSMYNMHQVPFKEIHLHGLVRDEKGQKMSKSKGNGIDPLAMCDKYGADALRFSLVVQEGSGRSVLMGESRVENYRNFTTKIWNAVRFCEMNEMTHNASDLSLVQLPINKWMITKLSLAAKEIAKWMETYAFNEASNVLYHFVWNTFCDKYLEAVKPIFYGNDEKGKAETRAVMGAVVDEMLKLIHPFMPFISEELWDKTAVRNQMLMETSWPDWTKYEDIHSMQNQDWIFDLITSVRSVRTQVNVPASTKIQLKIKDANDEQTNIINTNLDIIKSLARVENLTFTNETGKGEVAQVLDGLTLLIPLAGIVDVEKEKERLNKEIDNLTGFIARLKAQLSNEAFVSKAPVNIVEEKKKSLSDSELSLQKINDILTLLG
ncbi:MAG: valine--tRNA ligase [Alphaproteobacteria bacterium]|nr:valine--tRNA ligase [Alphaproteobacteria bacterium]